MEKILFLQEGFNKLKAELEHMINVDRPNIIEAIATARELGDLSENAEYHSAREQQGLIEAKIKQLTGMVNLAEVVDPKKMANDKIRFGATVTLEDEDENRKTYQIVSEYAADLENGKISVASPIARAILGKEEGDEIEFKAPGGTRDYEIIKVEYK